VLVLKDADALRKELLDNSQNIYRIDTKGDADNLRYRKLYNNYNAPPYRRIGYGHVLGASKDEKIDRSFPEDKGIVLAAPGREGRSSRSLLQKVRGVEQRKLRLVLPEENEKEGADDIEKDFVELMRGKKRKRGGEEVLETGEVDYRSIEGKTKPSEQPETSDVEFASSSDGGQEDEDEGRVTRLRNAEMSKRTKEHPQDLDAWLVLIEHQREVLGFGSGDLSHAKTRTLADIRVSIYEQALAVVKDIAARAKLTLGMLDEGAKLWEAKKLSSKWEEALKTFSTDPAVWTTYLNFIQSSHAEFRYERCRDEYIKCLGILSSALARQERGSSQATETSRILVYVFLRLTSLMRDAGYHEFAIALWQAVLELHFFRPASLRASDAIAQAFEEFWESEVPRIGEAAARGWSRFQPDAQDAPEPVTIELEPVMGTRRLFTRFAEAEKAAAEKLAMPGRSADDAGEDDPYHVVLFNDLSAILFPHMLLLEGQEDLIMAFLRFANLPPLPYAPDRHYDSWWFDPMLPQPEAKELLIPHYQATTDNLFIAAFAHLPKDFPTWPATILASLDDALPTHDLLAEYHIALSFQLSPATSGRVAKRLLKSRSSSLRLYNAYAILECRTKGLESGSKIFATAIGMADSLGIEQQRLKVLLYRTWIWEALRADDMKLALSILLSIGGDVNFAGEATLTPATELRVMRWLAEGRDAMLSAGETHLAVQHLELRALLAYFKHTRSVESAFNVFDVGEALLLTRGLAGTTTHECLLQVKAQLITHHLKHVHIYRPSLLRETLAQDIRRFPSNTLLLSTYTSLGTDLNLLAPSNLITDLLSSPQASLPTWSFALHSTALRSLDLGGTSHALRALFTRAISSPIGAHNPHLWTSYLRFETSQHDYAKARDVFMCGLSALPWWKGWVLMGLRELGDLLGFEEGSKVWRVLGEREMRVVVDVEEVVDGEREKRREDNERGRIESG
jgi:hypothetical protein